MDNLSNVVHKLFNQCCISNPSKRVKQDALAGRASPVCAIKWLLILKLNIEGQIKFAVYPKLRIWNKGSERSLGNNVRFGQWKKWPHADVLAVWHSFDRQILLFPSLTHSVAAFLPRAATSWVCLCVFYPQNIPFFTSHMAAAAPDLSHCSPWCLRLLMARLIMSVSKCLVEDLQVLLPPC